MLLGTGGGFKSGEGKAAEVEGVGQGGLEGSGEQLDWAGVEGGGVAEGMEVQ